MDNELRKGVQSIHGSAGVNQTSALPVVSPTIRIGAEGRGSAIVFGIRAAAIGVVIRTATSCTPREKYSVFATFATYSCERITMAERNFSDKFYYNISDDNLTCRQYYFRVGTSKKYGWFRI